MVVVAGSGIGEYDFSRVKVLMEDFDIVLCDSGFQVDGEKICKWKYSDIKEYIATNFSKEKILYVVSGSPLFFSAGSIVAKMLPFGEVEIVDNESSKEYLLKKLCIAQNEVESISLHGRDRIDLEKFLKSEYTFILCDRDSASKIDETLKYLNAKDFEITIGYKLGFKDEIIKKIDILKNLDLSFDLTKPYVLLIRRTFKSCSSFLDDDMFKTQRGMITKKLKRNITLQNLEIEPNQILWDIGAGSGSIGVEAYRRFRARVLFFEKNRERVENIIENLSNHKVVGCEVIEGEAQKRFAECEENPKRIFVGGGGVEVIEKIPYLYNRLESNGIMVLNAITLNHLALIINSLNDSKIEYEIFSISLTTYKGEKNLIEPQRELYQIKVFKR